MKAASLVLMLAVVAVVPARAADDESIERLVTCKDSWLDWKNDNAPQLKTFAEHFQSDFTQKESDPFFVPKSNDTIAGLNVTRVFPESVGMGVGFSVFVDATFDEAKRRFEQALGKPLQKCEVSDGMRTCGLEIAEKRTFMLMAEDDAKSTSTLTGCYYFYEK
jgi:hypothetical protein